MPGSLQSGNPAAASRNLLPAWLWPVLVSALAWVVIFLSIPFARQDFPLSDDWAFAHGAIWFAHGQGIHYSKWASMPQLGQWLWSWPFLRFIALPHVALRISTITLSWLGLAAFCDLLELEKVPTRVAAFASCVLALNPLFFISQGTYMTDVPALSFGLLALDFYLRATAAQNPRWLLPAASAAVLAVITRQTMLAVPIAAAVPILRNPATRRNPPWLLSLLVPVIACIWVNWWFSRRPDALPMHTSVTVARLLFRPFFELHWAGLAVLPLCLLIGRRRNRVIFLSGFAVMILAAIYFHFFGEGLPNGRLFPYSSGLLGVEGIRSETLVLGQRDVLITPPLQLALTILGCVGAADILAALFETFRARSLPGAVIIFAILQCLVILPLPVMWDRYLEVVFPGAILLIALRCSSAEPGWFAGIAAVALSGFLAIALFHDWLSWNSARWDLGRQAIATGIMRPSDIEGGFEWNAWYASADSAALSNPSSPGAASADAASLDIPFTRDFFPNVTGRFALAFTQPSNSIVLTSLPFSRWLPPARMEFLLVQQVP
jgi:hypothetical protein